MLSFLFLMGILQLFILYPIFQGDNIFPFIPRNYKLLSTKYIKIIIQLPLEQV